MAEIRHLANRHDVIFFCRGWSDLDKISQTGTEWHVDCADVWKWKPDVEFQYGGWNSYTLQCGTIVHDIDFVRWLRPAMWHVVLESWQWIHQVAEPCNVIRGYGMTCHWIRPNVRHTGILHLVSIFTHRCTRYVILYQSAKFYLNRTTLGRKEWRHVDCQDGGSQPSGIVGIQ